MRKEIEEQLKLVASTHFKNPDHRANLEKLWILVAEHFEEPENIEIISVSRTYKVIFKDGKVLKAYMAPKDSYHIIEMLHAKGIAIPKPAKLIKGNGFYWHFIGWIDGDCIKAVYTDKKLLHNIELCFWLELGKLLGGIHSTVWDGEGRFIGVSDTLWWNFVIHDKNVSLIDTKKFQIDYLPEKWLYQCILMNEHILLKQKLAFTEGYVTAIEGKRVGLGLEMLKAVKIFTDKLYEKLASK